MTITSHTVIAGENLWNIVKREFGLTNNTDIANTVNKVAKAIILKIRILYLQDKNLIWI